ncbi:hypothetical protein HJG39_17455 [Alteromonas sp. a30]|nr:hypothetical protein [Alteromonas sp. a30]
MFGEGEWEVKKHGIEQRRSWRKLHLAVDAQTPDIIRAMNKLTGIGMPETYKMA